MSDITDRNIILVLVICLILYLVYIRGVLKAKRDVKYFKCNPVNLFLQSINADEETGIQNFQTCISQINNKIHPTS
jgi:hypothetical protein